MLQISKLTHSRNDWKNKAVKRAEEIKALKKAQKRHKQKMADIKLQLKSFQQAAEDNKKNTYNNSAASY
jgi:hypothetical protein